MNLLEFEGKQLFSEYNIPTPRGVVIDDQGVAGDMDYPAVIKAQVPTGGRGKAGGIRIVRDESEAKKALGEILGMTIRGHPVNKVLVEEKIEGKMELYVSIAVDRSKRLPLIMASAMGGMDIESVPDEKIFREWIDPWVGLQPYSSRAIFYGLGLESRLAGQLQSVLQALWNLFQGMDAELVEINPLVVTTDGRLLALDSKVVLDDDALFRHDRYRKLMGDITPLEKRARDQGIAFVQLDGNIGVIANGAGLTMATLDFLKLHGGRGGVFLDLGGTDDPEKVEQALLLMAEARPRVILLNIFGGITKCDTVADGLLQAITDGGIDIPIVARIKGVNEKKAVEMMSGSKIAPVLSLDEAARTAVSIVQDGGD